jgi:ribosomal protein L7/L12
VSQALNCPNCGSSIDFDPGDDLVVRCQYCRSTVVLPEALRRPSIAVSASSQANALWPQEFFQPGKIAKIQEISRLVQRREKIKAIDAYREVFGVGLREAGDAIERFTQGNDLSIHSLHQPKIGHPQLEEEIQNWLQKGNRIEAIKVYRQATGQGLLESKDAVEVFERNGILPLPSDLEGEGGQAHLSNRSRRANQMIAIVELLQAGQQVSAIEAYRQAFHADLNEAQAAIHKIGRGVTVDNEIDG